jgi:hypothetical protein
MVGLSRWLGLAGKITWGLNGRAGRRWPAPRRKPFRRVTLDLGQLEDRVVPTLLGQQLFPSDYPWNQNISNAPVAANSAAIISHIGSSIRVHPDWGQDSPTNGTNPLYGIPFNVVHGNSTAKVNVVIDNYPGESDVVGVPIPANAVIEGDFQNGPNLSGGGYNVNQRGDSHLIVWDEDNNIAYELYGVSRPNDPTLFPNTSGVELTKTDTAWHAAQESVWNMKADSFRSLGWTSADAAGLSILAGLARPDEGLPVALGGQGAINHALRFTLPSGDVNPQYIYPASHVVNDSSGSTKLPFGARLRLMNTPAVNAVIATLGPQAQIIAHAMEQYGLVLADIGSAMYVTGSSASENASNAINFTWDMNDVLGLSSLNAGDFEVVNLTPVVTGLSMASGLAGSTVTITGQNFSGSAGHLSVFFGSTPATSVTFVDDSHLTAVVPAGAGTVHVTVRSGVNATDPNNPSDNVNNPVFGYGTSAASAADQFTYSGQTISGANSAVSFATSTDTSGNADTLIVVVKDTTGNAVSGLASSAFAFGLSGGTSAGTFGAVTETATHGTYTVAFTGTTAGTASTLTVNVAGVTLTARPTVTVVAGSVSGTTSTVRLATPTVAAGGTDTVTVVVKDGAGNPIGGLSGSAFSFSLSGGTSAGTFGTVTATSTPGTYTATFTGTTAGTAGTLIATVSGVSLTSAGVVVNPGSVSLSRSAVSVAPASVGVGGTLTVTLTAVDAYGNAEPSGLSVQFRLGTGSGGGSFGAVSYAGGGKYTAVFTASVAGNNTVTATVNGQALTSTPASLTVTSTPVVHYLVRVSAGGGVWRYTDASGWLQLTPSAATYVGVDSSGDVAAEFPGYGVWRYTNAAGWKQINGVDVTQLATDHAGDVVAAFPGYGVGEYSVAAGWRMLTASQASLLAVNDQGTVVGEFPGYGVWQYQPASGWKQINGVDVNLLGINALGVVVANFAGYGVGEYQPAGGWRLLNGTQASALAVDDQGDVAAEFHGVGVGEYTATGAWRLLTASNAARLAANAVGDFFAAFAGYGVWEYDPARGWVQLSTSDAALLAAC